MRESIAQALYAGLGDEEGKDTPVTRVAAFAGSSRLGTTLWRLKYANDPKSFKPALYLIAKKLPRHYILSARISASEWSLHEWLHEFCRTCLGAKVTMVGDKLITCETCEGLGKHRFSDRERKTGMGTHYDPNMLRRAQEIITKHDIWTDSTTRRRLER